MKISRRILISLVLLIFSFEGIAQLKVVKFPELEAYLSGDSEDQVRVVNFWATWCGPCIKELPYFEEVKKEYTSEQLEVLLVSLDFADKENRVNNFIEKKGITSNVWLLDEIDANSYIDLVDTRWSGAIPMTLLIKPSTGERIILEKELTKEELKKHIDSLMN